MTLKGKMYKKRDVGAHLHSDDPYLPRGGYKEPTVCPTCKAIYYNKKWALEEQLSFSLKKLGEFHYQKCPACRKIEDRYPMGILHLSGKFLNEHKDELINLIRSEERRGREKNPLERVIKIEEMKYGLNVETTTESLALRLGRVLSRAYKGKIKYRFSQEEKLIRINWQRD
ncbi:MAG: BCAM0308 family protein [Candidatus Edwardsbacteria bacterium]